MKLHPFLTTGVLVVLYWLVYKPLSILYRWHKNRTSTRSEEILKPGANDYAVITGATDGIGLEYARQLAEKGYNLVLLSRTEEKLKRVAQEIQKQYPQSKKIEHLAVDFSRTDIYDRIRSKLTSLDGPIHVLVNNVGMIHPCPEYFANFPEGFLLNQINTNMVSMTLMSEIVLQLVTKQKSCPVSKRPKAVIINVSSAAGNGLLPLMSVYSASKKYMNHLSRILAIEYAADNIIVQTVTPGQVDTKMAATYKDESMMVNTKDFVQYALKTVGNEQQTNAHPRHKFINSAMELLGNLPDTWYDKVSMVIMKKLRADYDKKYK